jgi:hypothetical protein
MDINQALDLGHGANGDDFHAVPLMFHGSLKLRRTSPIVTVDDQI